jgi:hypothetical protein
VLVVGTRPIMPWRPPLHQEGDGWLNISYNAVKKVYCKGLQSPLNHICLRVSTLLEPQYSEVLGMVLII